MHNGNKYATFVRSKRNSLYMMIKQAKKDKQAKKESPEKKEKRTHGISFTLNDKEFKAIERHLKKYKITNKANWCRRTILAHIWQKLAEDYPMLFDEQEMRQGNTEPDKANEGPTLFDEQEMRQGTT